MSRLLPVVCLLLLPAMARADVWDTQTQNDNTNATENELVHGSDQLHDLGVLAGPAADQDFYRIRQQPYSSYEIVADATSGDIGLTLQLERLIDGTTVDPSVAAGLGFSRSLRFRNTGGVNDDNDLVRIVSGPGNCTTNCGPDDVYRIRAYDTTYAIARFNNTSVTNVQVTSVIIQNTTAATVDATIYFWNAAGALLHTQVVPAMAAKAVYVFNSSTVPALQNQSGSITITNTAPYGRLNGKAVALELVAPGFTTGYTFDTPMMPIPH